MSLPKPRETLRSTLERILPFIGDRDFKLLKSAPSLRKRSGDFTFRIAFNAPRWNLSVECVRFQMVAIVESKSLQVWRQSQAVPILAMHGPQSGRLAWKAFDDGNTDHWSWDLSGRKPDGGTVARLLNTISEDCLPWLELCTDPANFPKLGLPADLCAANFVELALSRDDRGLACEIVNAAIRELPPGERAVLRGMLKRSTIHDFPARLSNVLKPLVGVIVVNNLEVGFPA